MPCARRRRSGIGRLASSGSARPSALETPSLNSSGAMGQSTRRSAAATGSGPCGPHTELIQVERDHLVVELPRLVALVEAGLDDLPEPAGQEAADARHEPDGMPAWRATAAAAREPATATNASGPTQAASSSTRSAAAAAAPRPARGTSAASTSERRRRRTRPEPSLATSTTSTSRSPRARQRLGHHLGPAQHAHGGVVGHGQRELPGRAVGVELLDRGPRLAQRVGRGADPRRHPPQGAGCGMAGQHAPAGHDPAGGIVPEGGE